MVQTRLDAAPKQISRNLAVSQDLPGWVAAHDIAMGYGPRSRVATLAASAYEPTAICSASTSGTWMRASGRRSRASTPRRTSRSTAPRATRGIFKAYLDAAALLPCCPAALQAASPVVDKYVGTLGGADVFTVDNAFALLESRRVDTGALGPFGIRP